MEMEMLLQHSSLDMVVSVFVCWSGGFGGSMCSNLSNNQSSPYISVPALV